MPKKQLEIAGTERQREPEIDSAAEAYVEQRDKRMKLTEKEVTAKEALIAVMKKHKLEVYRDDSVSPPLVVTLVPGKDKVKVTEADAANEGEETDEEAA